MHRVANLALEISEVVWYNYHMFKQKPFPFSLIVLAVLVSLHSLGSYLSWYWFYPWFDMPVHIISGLWIALVFLWLASIFGELKSLRNYKIKAFLIAFITAAFVGVAWELIENFTQITSVRSPDYSFNTTKDILSDCLGGLLAFWYFIQIKKCTFKKEDYYSLHPFYDKTGIVNHEANV